MDRMIIQRILNSYKIIYFALKLFACIQNLLIICNIFILEIITGILVHAQKSLSRLFVKL